MKISDGQLRLNARMDVWMAVDLDAAFSHADSIQRRQLQQTGNDATQMRTRTPAAPGARDQMTYPGAKNRWSIVVADADRFCVSGLGSGFRAAAFVCSPVPAFGARQRPLI